MSTNENKWANLFPVLAMTVFVGLVVLSSLFEEFKASDETKLWVSIVIVIAFVGMILGGLTFVYRKIPQVAGVTNFVVLLLIVCAFSIVPAALLGTNDRVVVLKIGGVIFLSILPGWLYLQFLSVKGTTFWSEYVLNLYRLRVDGPSHLPVPPQGSVYEKPAATGSGDGRTNLYQSKFLGLYGHSLEHGSGDGGNNKSLRFQGENLFPVIITTFVLAVAWAIALQPELLRNSTDALFAKTIQQNLKDFLPSKMLFFGFIGAYFYILQMLVRRYYQDDLKTSAYINATVRIVTVAVLVTAVHAIWPDEGKAEIAFAFLIGIFPEIGVQAIRAVISLPLRPIVPSLKKQFPLSDLDGMNIWYESRLLEEGIEDLQNLATANIVDIMLRTRVPVDRLVDWIDQAHLFLRARKDDVSKEQRKAGKLSSREKLRRLGIRTATDLENVFESKDKALREQVKWVLGDSGQPPSATQTMFETLRDEPNLYHVRQWKKYGELLDEQEKK
jgi:hypothetical protein